MSVTIQEFFTSVTTYYIAAIICTGGLIRYIRFTLWKQQDKLYRSNLILMLGFYALSCIKLANLGLAICVLSFFVTDLGFDLVK